VSTNLRYFADGVVTLKAISAGLKNFNPNFKIDGGELVCGTELLGEIEIVVSGTDFFNDDLAAQIADCERLGTHEAYQVIQRIQGASSIITIRVMDGERDPAATWDMLSPMWTVLPSISSGLTRVDGQGIYDGSQLIIALA